MYKYIYEQENSSYRIVHSLDGYDEISLTSAAKIISPEKEFLLSPSEVIKAKITSKQLSGGKDVKESADLFVNILKGNGTEAQKAAVVANAAMAIQCFHKDQDYIDSLEIAMKSLKNKSAYQSFKKVLSL